ncbi:hypothetical protein BDA96_01G288200 [Sorghum bicolor]|uniref:Thaumatin-like protein n=1 Tax=Sorghum bicolor TaxID=4558 RepID=A0A921S1E3_SORBI|nr:hypothetical protein BDA96_01G288200 [Sorghum bicolor]
MELPRSCRACARVLRPVGVGSGDVHVRNRCTTRVAGVLSNAGSPSWSPQGSSSRRGRRAGAGAGGWSAALARTAAPTTVPRGGRLRHGDCGSGSASARRGRRAAGHAGRFTLDGSGRLDFYDVSLVDGYTPRAGGDLRGGAPPGRRPPCGGGAACRSACDAFARPEYCCSGAFASPAACRPTAYSQVFKTACPRSYSYAFDDPTSTFTCGGGPDYTVTFCPGATQGPAFDSVTGTTTTTTVPGRRPQRCRDDADAGPTPAMPTGTMMPGTTFTDATPDSAMPMGGGGLGIEGGDSQAACSWAPAAAKAASLGLANMATGDASAVAAPQPQVARLVVAPLATLLCGLHLRQLLL